VKRDRAPKKRIVQFRGLLDRAIRPGIYSKLQVSEVWRFGDETMSIEQLDGSGNYVAVEMSQFLFVRADEVIRWLREGKSMARPAWKRAIAEWARAELRPRAGI
jgi:hypothetical protein